MGELAQKIRVKYPGSYDALSDTELESKITAKYPGVYDHLVGPIIQGKPDASKSETEKMQREFIRKEGTRATRRDQGVNTIKDYVAEPLRFAAESVTIPLNAGLRGLKSAASTVQAGGEAIRTGDIDAGLRKYAEKQAEFVPLTSPLEPSATGEMISNVVGKGVNKLSDLTGRPDIVEPVAQAGMDIGALMGLRGVVKGVSLADVAKGAGRGVNAVVGRSLNALPDSFVTPESLTRSALKPYIGDNVAKNRATSKGIDTFLTDRKSANPETFLNKNVAEMEQIVGRQNILLDQKGNVRANIAPVEKSLNDFINEARTTPGTAESAVTAAEKVLSDIKNHPDYNPVDNTAGISTLQTMKKNTWRYLKDKGAFSRDTNPQLNDAMWSAADGMAKIVSDVIPEMAAENARYGEIANLNKMLTRSVNRIANTNVVSLHSAMQLIRGDWKGFGMAVVMKTIDHPTFKSYLAQQMAKAQGRTPKAYKVNQAVESIKKSVEQFNPEVLPGKQSSQMDLIPGNTEKGLEQGGYRFENPTLVQREQTVSNPEQLPGTSYRQETVDPNATKIITRQKSVENPEIIPGRQSSQMEEIVSSRLTPKMIQELKAKGMTLQEMAAWLSSQ